MYVHSTAKHQPTRHARRAGWQDAARLSSQELPAAERSWLLDTGSLTQRLLRVSQGHFRVEVLCHDWQRPRADESALLGMGLRERAIVREVILRCHDQPWVFARSIIPARTLRGHLQRLRKFDDSSLGELLFRDPSMRRYPFEVAALKGDSPFLPTSLHQNTPLWSRRCRFELGQKPLLVGETFLTDFRPE